jgi:hypothetical protein
VALAVLDLNKSIEFSQSDFSAGRSDGSDLELMQQLHRRRTGMMLEQQEFVAACDRWDALYYPPSSAMLPGGVSHWSGHSSARLPGRSHISINTPPVYVDIPASLQAVTPIENVSPLEDSDESRMMAAMVERLYFAWKGEIDFDLAGHRACVVKGLYGRTAGKVFWDSDLGFPRVEVVDQPRNLWLGWGQSDYRSLDWAAYAYLMTPEAIYAEYGLIAVERKDDQGNSYPYLVSSDMMFSSYGISSMQPWSGGLIEVIDYWYRQPDEYGTRDDLGRVKHDTWNAIVVGNSVAQNAMFPEYDGKVPYIPLFNSYIPGVPNGRPELFDIEPLIREKDERMTSGSQLLHNVVNSQYWQLVGADAPDQVPLGLRPKPNQVVAPGAGNRIEKIDPWMPGYELEQFLSRIDREMIDVSGLNDLLRGLAPAAVMSSSKAINALVANYETRISMKRDLYYRWRKEVWEMVRRVWAAKQTELEPVIMGSGRLILTAPSLTPRDDMETAQIARTLVDGKLWSSVRGMDRVGVDDPEQEQNIIRGEQTDVSLNPAAVQVIAAVAQQLQAMGMQNAQQAMQGLAGGQGEEMTPEDMAANMDDMREQMGAAAGVPGSGEQPMPGQEALPANVEGAPPGSGEAPMMGPDGEMLNQTMIKGGEPSNRLMMQQQIGG